MKFKIKLLLISLILIAAAFADAKTEAIILTPRNTVTLRGPINSSSAIAVQRQLLDLAFSRKVSCSPIYLVLDSPGGSIDSGNDILETVKSICGVRTITIFAASMASAIVQQTPGSRLITDNGVMMFHRASGGFRGQFEDGEVESRLAASKLLVRLMEQRNADRLGILLTDYKARVVNEWWMTTGDSAIAQKAADKKVIIYCTKALTDSVVKHSADTLFGTIHFSFSGCPMFRSPEAVQPPENMTQMQAHESIKSYLRGNYEN